MKKQLAATGKAAWLHLYQISKILKYLTQDKAKYVVQAHVTCQLDQNNSFLIGLCTLRTVKDPVSHVCVTCDIRYMV